MWDAVYKRAKRRHLLPEEAQFQPRVEPFRVG
jgi:hypothetical protein